ncbi:MAG: hypothetical protein MUP97_06895 [Acidimicrobiia bacterium]|nr:hypothetical protein [Acidimicrobiia bacterium]
MDVAAGPFSIAAVLLALGGALKALRPADTATALRGVGIPVPRLAVRLGGAGEAAIGIWALVVGDRLEAVLVTASYAVFIGFVVLAMTRDAPIASCGCFGRADTPPSLVHVGVNVGACIAALVVVVQPGVGLIDVLPGQPLAGVPYVFLVVVGVLCAFVALTQLPRTLQAMRESYAS